jgi:hypothetical protein
MLLQSPCWFHDIVLLFDGRFKKAGRVRPTQPAGRFAGLTALMSQYEKIATLLIRLAAVACFAGGIATAFQWFVVVPLMSTQFPPFSLAGNLVGTGAVFSIAAYFVGGGVVYALSKPVARLLSRDLADTP